jgi:2-keto-4-pentenoate hydratase/2-oxohepta-3-ene-1,7-dioic acid hydratase in catechol pathway
LIRKAAAISAGLTHDPDFDWTSNRQILQISSKGQSELERAARELVSTDRSRQSIETAQAIHASNEVRLGPPIPDPEKIICLGLNYRSHAEEAGLAVP